MIKKNVVKRNCLIKLYFKTFDANITFKKIEKSFVKIRIFNNNIINSIKTYFLKIKIRDNENKKHTSKQIFYFF